MFQIGDNIVYPMQGVGYIKAIEEKEILGEKKKYYVINFPVNNMELMIPMGKITKSGIRSVVDSPTLENVLDIFQHGESDKSLTWKQRYKVNMDKMKTGNLRDGAEVVRDLMRISKEKALNPSEKQMLENARKVFVSELGVIKGISINQASDILETAYN